MDKDYGKSHTIDLFTWASHNNKHIPCTWALTGGNHNQNTSSQTI